MEQPEAKLKKALAAGFEKVTGKAGWWSYLVPRGAQKCGTPDQVFVWQDRTIWVEGKAGNNWLSTLQAIVTANMVMAGSRVFVLRWTEETRDAPKKKRYAELFALLPNGGGSVRQLWSWSSFKTEQFWATLMHRSYA
jgi:hypothetical protein